MIPVNKDELDDIFAALDASRQDIADICGLSPHAPGRWRQSGRMPTAHLRRLANALAEKLKGKDPLTPVEERAMSNLLIKKALIDATGTAIPNLNNALFYDPKVVGMPLAHLNASSNFSAQNTHPLVLFTDQALVQELERRGWSVQLNLKGKHET